MSKIDLNLIISIISKHIKVPEKDINIDSKSSDFYQWDSLAQVNIILEVEKKTNLDIKASKMGELTSVKSILNYLEK
jgi:acyl carrier protein|tara:strand:- start:21 stop:251 length:231 start_codon:yes stop_codon:yes gene_type:complete